MAMKKVSTYEAFKWLAKIKNAGFKEFTVKEIKECDLYDVSYFQCLNKKKILKQTRKEQRLRCSGVGTYVVRVWEINEHLVKRHQFRNLIFPE